MRILLIILLTVLSIGFVIFYLLRRRFDIEDPTGVPPLRIHLIPDHDSVSNDSEKVQEIYANLNSKGFQEIGVYLIAEMPGLVLRALTNTEHSLCAVIYDHPVAGAFVDIMLEYQNGRGLTVSNAPAGEELDHMPGREKIIDASLNELEILQRALRERQPGPYKRIDTKNFVDEFQSAYAREMDWRMSRGGPTEDEVRRSASKMGIISEETIQRSTESLRQEYTETHRILPCEKNRNGDCPYEYDRNSDRDIEGMPFVENDPRSCPKYGHICPEFMEDFDLTPEDLEIRATIHCGAIADQLAKEGKLQKDSPEYVELSARYEQTLRLYPRKKYPNYY